MRKSVLSILLICMLSTNVFATEVSMTEEIETTDESNEVDISKEENNSDIIELDNEYEYTEKQRLHKETMIKERVIAEITQTANAIDLSGESEPDSDIDPTLFYLCYDGLTDYVLSEWEDTVYVFYVRRTEEGEYYLSKVNVSSSIEDKFYKMMVKENAHTTNEFWNKVPMSRPEENEKVTLRPVDANGVMLVPYFNQGAGYYIGNGEWTCQDWPNITFNVNGHTMHEAGCGFFSTAMALSYLKQRTIAPVEFKENGQYIANEGSADTVGVATAAMYGIHAYFTSNINEVKEALRNGHPVMEHVGESIFTNGGHYILLVGYTRDGMFAVNDPGHVSNTYFYNGVTFNEETILSAAKNIETAFTIFE